MVLPPTSNGHSIRENLLLWFSQPRSGLVAAFESSHSTSSVFFSENSAEGLAGWVYGIGVTTDARISGGRMESVYGVARVHGTGDFPARGTQIEGLSVDCESLRAPAIELQRSEGALVSGISFYQTRTPHPHVLLHPQSAATTMFAIGTDGEAPLRIVDRSRGLSWVGGSA